MREAPSSNSEDEGGAMRGNRRQGKSERALPEPDKVSGKSSSSQGQRSETQSSELDDIMLGMLHSQLSCPRAATSCEPSSHGAAILLLSIIRKAAAVASEDGALEQLSAILNRLLDWRPSILRLLSRIAEAGGQRGELLSAFFLAATLRRHWAAAVLALAEAVGGRLVRAPSTEDGRVGGQLNDAVTSLLHVLKSIATLLSGGGSLGPDEGLEASLVRSGENAMEFLLLSGHSLAVDLLEMMRRLLDRARDSRELLSALLLVSSLISLFARIQLSEGLRDLAIALDLLAQVDLQPSSPAKTSPACSQNQYQAALSRLLFGLSNLSERLASERGAWVHSASCKGRRCRQDSCWVREAGAYHHHSLAQLEEEGPGGCAVAFLNSLLLACLRNIAGAEDKTIAYQALATAGHCCCLRPEHLLTQLLPELQPQPPSLVNQTALLRCVRELGRRPTVSLRSCEVCESATKHSDGDWARLLGDLLSEAGKSLVRQLLGLLWQLLPALGPASREALLASALLPALGAHCQRLLAAAPASAADPGTAEDRRLLLAFLPLATAALMPHSTDAPCPYQAYDALMKVAALISLLGDLPLNRKHFAAHLPTCRHSFLLLRHSGHLYCIPPSR